MPSVALLGVKGGPAIRPGSSMPTSHLLRLGGRTVLVDAGLGAARGVMEQGVGLHALDLIVITHLHSDHYLELGPLLHTAWTAGLKRPMRVIGPAGLAAYFEAFWSAMAFDIELRIADEGRPDIREMVDLQALREGAVLDEDGLHLRAMRNVHPPIEDSFALRFEGEGKAVVFSGDTAPMAEMVGFAKGADLLVHEAMLLEGVDALCARVGNGDDRLKTHLLRSHTPAGEAGRIATQAGVGALALNHLIPNDDPDFTESHWRAEVAPHWSGPLHIGRDGMVIAF
jgi:ribonuclease BN (tRNA processing enzyme)